MAGGDSSAESATSARLRFALGAILVIGLVGTGTELLLLKHFEDRWQLVPLALIAVALCTLGWYRAARSATPLRVLRPIMWAFVVASGVGLVQHFRSNVTDAKESNPSLSGRALYADAISGSIPSLAPGAMLQLGLVGLAFVFRHPRLRPLADATHPSTPGE